MVVKNKNTPLIDFDHVRALNDYIDPRFLNSTLQSIRGGSVPKPGDIQEYRINNTPFIVSVYPDDDLRGGKQVLLLHSIHRLPDSFNNASIESSMASLDINQKEVTGGKKKGVASNTKKTSSAKIVKKRTTSKKKGGAEDFEQNHDEVEELGGVNLEIVGGKKNVKKVKMPYAR